MKYGHSIVFSSFKVGFESSTKVIVSGPGSSIFFGAVNYFYRFGNLEVLEGGQIQFGDNVSINKGFSIVCRTKITFGNNIMIGPNVMIYDHDHKFLITKIPFQQQGFTSKAISIGNNVWIGANVFIASGVTVGSNVVIAAGSIVTKDVLSFTVVGGNPIRVLKKMDE